MLEKEIPVLISARARQEFDGAEADETELFTEGTLVREGELLRLRYEESELTGMEGTVTTFELTPSRVILRRSGSVNSQMVFEEGKQHTSLYETPVGALTVDICTGKLRQTMSARGGVLEIHYSIAVEHVVTGKNYFRLRVREKSASNERERIQA